MNNKEIVNLLKLYIQKPSFIDLVSVSSDSWKECLKDDMEMIRSWKLNHEKDYAHFKAEVMHASYGDYTAYMKTFKLAISCIPETVLQDIHHIMTGMKQQSVIPEHDAFISALINMQGYLEFNKVEMECDIDIPIKDMHLDIVQEKSDEKKFIYERIPSTLEFFYRLPWDWQCAMRTLSPQSSDMELATMARSLYLKICLTQDEIMHNIEMVGKRRDTLVMCVFYFIVFDHGLKTAYNALVRSLEQEQNLGIFNKTIIPTLKRLIATSIEHGQDSKAAWNKEIISTTSNGKLRNEMLSVVQETKGISGRPRTATNIVTLNSLLQGNVRSIVALIKKYRAEMYRPVDLAYLFIILHQAGLVKEHYYTIFHHAMEEYEGKKYNLRNPQEVYNNFPINEEILEKHGTAQQKRKAKEIDSWVDRFKLFRKSA